MHHFRLFFKAMVFSKLLNNNQYVRVRVSIRVMVIQRYSNMHHFRPFFKATVFAKLLNNDPYGRISIMQFFNYVMRKVWLHQTRIGLSLYDVAGLGHLRESVSHHLHLSCYYPIILICVS